MLGDKCQLRINRDQLWRDALLLLRCGHAQIAVEFPNLSLEPENIFARGIDLLVDTDDLTGQVVSNSTEASLLRAVGVFPRTDRGALRSEVEDWNIDGDSSDQNVSIIFEIADVERRSVQIHRGIESKTLQAIILLCLLDIRQLDLERRMQGKQSAKQLRCARRLGRLWQRVDQVNMR